MQELSYKDAIEKLQSYSDYEARGDALYMKHEDEEARLEWAFYRPSGSHPEQIKDESHIVAIMAFNHSRLGALERFNLLSSEIINNDILRNKIRNRSRMLFRAMIDDDFNDLVEVLQKYPVFLELANDQMINGRIWNEIYAQPVAASKYLFMLCGSENEKILEGVKRRLQRVKSMNVDEAKSYLELLTNQVQNLHSYIKEQYVKEYEEWMTHTTLHPLQKVLWQKKINLLKDSL